MYTDSPMNWKYDVKIETIERLKKRKSKLYAAWLQKKKASGAK